MARFWRLLLLGCTALSGCGSEMMEPPPPPAPIGDVVVTWSIVNESDDPTSCQTLGFSEARVNLGGRQVVVPCGEVQRVEFKMVPYGRQPIVIQLFILGNVVAEEQASNVVLDGPSVTKDLVFKVDRVTGNQGAILASWIIDGQIAENRCPAVGATTVSIKTLPGSIEDFMREVDCVEGETTFESIRSGGYVLQFDLRDADGNILQTLPSGNLVVIRGETTAAPVFFGSVDTEFGSLLAQWDIKTGTTSTTCPSLSHVRLRIAIPNPNGGDTEIRSTTVACERREFLEPELAADLEYNLSINLRDQFNSPLTDSAIFRDIEIDTSSTTTVAADLTLN